MTEGQRTLANFAEAEQADLKNSRYFKPEVNIPYELTFTNVKEEPDASHPHFRLVEKMVPDFNDKERKVPKVVLILQVDSINGDKVEQEWSVLSVALRKVLEAPCTSGMLLKKKYRLKASGEGRNRTWSFSEIGDR